MTSMTGHCLCGAVRFTAEDVDTSFHTCHCGMCRRWAGGPMFAATVGNVQFDGEENINVFDSSDWGQRGFCRRCGSKLFYRLKATGAHYLAVGTFDDADAFRLAGEIYVDHQPAGYRFAGDLHRMTEEQVLAQFMSPGTEPG
jgi:hypothetical protein